MPHDAPESIYRAVYLYNPGINHTSELVRCRFVFCQGARG